MSRFSPNVAVQDRSGEILANAITQTFDQVMQRRRQKQVDAERRTERDEQRQAQDLTLALQGLHRGTAPAEAPVMQAGVPMATQFGQIATPARAPERFTQVTPEFYRNEQYLAEQANKARETKLADALFNARIPQMADPEGFALGRRKTLAEIARLEREPKPTPVQLKEATTNEGVVTWNPITGQPVSRLGSRPQPAPRTGSGSGSVGRPTEMSNKAALVYGRAAEAANTLEEFFTKGAPSESVLGKVPLVGNYFTPENSQRLNQAAETVSAAILRLESGAAISESEIRSYARQFLPEPGDSPEVRAQKWQTMRTQLARIRETARPSLGESADTGSDALAPLTGAQIKRAQSDSAYRQFLADKGYRF